MKRCVRWGAAAYMLAAAAVPVSAGQDWSAIAAEARGQTVNFNAWGGNEMTNAYIGWAGEEVSQRYGVRVRHVKVTNTAGIIQRIQTEMAAGRRQHDGSVDLMWVNGENFKRLKQDGLLFGPWAEQLPNWQYVDLDMPVQVDFSVPTEGLESPWGAAQLTFIADKATTPVPPRSASELLTFARAHPGRISYPQPPDFHGTTFLKQLLLELTDNLEPLYQPVSDATFEAVSAPLWAYLEQLHPHMWRDGQAFPTGIAEMHRMLADRELDLSLTFNPNEAVNLIASHQLPATAYSFGFEAGTIGNVHFLAIPVNARAKAGAQVLANFLLSPEAQVRKADIRVWGDPTVLAVETLPTELREAMNQAAPGAPAKSVPTLAEPHASWMKALEAEWLKRYGSR